LKTQCKQAFQVVLPHVALLAVAPRCPGGGREASASVFQGKHGKSKRVPGCLRIRLKKFS